MMIQIILMKFLNYGKEKIMQDNNRYHYSISESGVFSLNIEDHLFNVTKTDDVVIVRMVNPFYDISIYYIAVSVDEGKSFSIYKDGEKFPECRCLGDDLHSICRQLINMNEKVDKLFDKKLIEEGTD